MRDCQIHPWIWTATCGVNRPVGDELVPGAVVTALSIVLGLRIALEAGGRS
jgi:hypothetical protein